mmetsp:Transcript_12770/g.38319  ORF Transcript_12770/g.38319 Transcript_12770/m.38319 type:complete len:354 (+) Transcript_12770:657-1718(+)
MVEMVTKTAAPRCAWKFSSMLSSSSPTPRNTRPKMRLRKIAEPKRAMSASVSRVTWFRSRCAIHLTSRAKRVHQLAPRDALMRWDESPRNPSAGSPAGLSGACMNNPRRSISSMLCSCITNMTKSELLYVGGHWKPLDAKNSTISLMLPSKTTRPERRRITTSKRPKTSEGGWWMVHATVAPAFATFFSSCTTVRAENESRPDVGSSRKTIFGLVMRSTPTEVLLRCPPEMPGFSADPTRTSAHSSRPSSTRRLCTRPSRSAEDSVAGSRSAAEKLSASRGVVVGSRASSCMTYATLARFATVSISSPSILTTPLMSFVGDGAMRPASTFSRLDLPAPLGPIMAQICPPGMEP